MGWNDHVDFDTKRRIERIVEDGDIDGHPECDFLREVTASPAYLLEKGCYRSAVYRESPGLIALSEERDEDDDFA